MNRILSFRTSLCCGLFGLLFFCTSSQAIIYISPIHPMEASFGEKSAAKLNTISPSDILRFIKINLKNIISPSPDRKK